MSPRSRVDGRARATTRARAPGTRIALLSTYPPTQCGLASFAAALRGGLLSDTAADTVGVVRMVDEPTWTSGPGVVYELATDGRGDTAMAAARLNQYDLVVVQHEYGIFGGPDGSQVLEIVNRVRVPMIVVLHTVLSAPTAHQREVLERVCATADVVVTMTQTGRRRLETGYRIDANKITVIPHGAWPGGRPVPAAIRAPRPVVLTWGLLGPGKGVEWGIDALPGLRVIDPPPLYVVAGQTHPRVLARDGERYRNQLRDQATALGVTDMLHFEAAYLDLDSLRRLVAGADVVLLPYDSHEQVTSGVLIEAVASLTPVVSTTFPHARELLADGVGTLVPHADPAAIGAALRQVLTEPARAAGMAAAAARIAPTLEWSAVAERYRAIGEVLLRRAAKVA